MNKPDYVKFYDGLLTESELRRAEEEIARHGQNLPPKPLQNMVGTAVGALPHAAKIALINHSGKTLEKQGHTLEDVTEKLNHKLFVLSHLEDRATPIADVAELGMLFEKGKKEKWPTLVMVSNGNFVSPQNFADVFLAAKSLVPKLTSSLFPSQRERKKLVIAGSYFSKPHVYANARDTTARYRELGLEKRKDDELSPAAEVTYYQLLDMLLERRDDGSVMLEQGRPVLREDADEILKHIVFFGYSAGHMTNKDAVRQLYHIIDQGHVAAYPSEPDNVFPMYSTTYKANKLISGLRLIGIAGADRLDEKTTPPQAKEVVFLSDTDISTKLFGTRYRDNTQVIKLAMQDDQGAITDDIGNHALASYMRALASPVNKDKIKTARVRLDDKILGY